MIWMGAEHAPLINFDNDVVLNRLGRQVDRRFCRGQRPRQPSHPHSEEMSKKKRDVPHEQEGGKGVLAGVGITAGLQSRFTLSQAACSTECVRLSLTFSSPVSVMRTAEWMSRIGTTR